jgi:hypothetical protein
MFHHLNVSPVVSPTNLQYVERNLMLSSDFDFYLTETSDLN